MKHLPGANFKSLVKKGCIIATTDFKKTKKINTKINRLKDIHF